MVVCGEAGRANEAIDMVQKLKPDLVVMDITIPGRDGLDLIKDLKARHPDLLVVVFSMHDEALYAERALRAGARGYVMKSEGPGDLVRAIREVLRGGLFVSEAGKEQILRRLVLGREEQAQHGVHLLSDRELQVFRLLGKGDTTRAIATQLHVGTSTVESYRANVKLKLGLSNASELVSCAARFVAGNPDD